MRPITKPAPTSYGPNITLGGKPTNPLYQLFNTLANTPGSGVTFIGATTSGSGSRNVTMPLLSYEAGLFAVNQWVIAATGPTCLNASNAEAEKKNFLGGTGGNFGVSNVFNTARLDLTSSLGQFCSFCEMPVTDSALAVEHILPKSMFLDKAVNYNNFLLACQSCNSYKGTNPTPVGSLLYHFPISWSNPQIPHNLSNTWPTNYQGYTNLENVICNAYMWPIYQNAYKNFLNVLESPSSPTGFVPVPTPNPTNSGISSIQNGMIQATLNGFGPTGPVRVTIQGNTKGISARTVPVKGPSFPRPAADVKPSSKAMIEKFSGGLGGDGNGLLNLNNDDASPSFSDRRMFNRTKAYFLALGAFNRLSQAQTSGGTGMYLLLLQEVVSTAGSAGFFSTWVTVFNNYANANSSPTGPVATGATCAIPNATVDFVLEATRNASSPTGLAAFPGTNIVNSIP